MMTGALVLPVVTEGMMDASTTLTPFTLLTLSYVSRISHRMRRVSLTFEGNVWLSIPFPKNKMKYMVKIKPDYSNCVVNYAVMFNQYG